MELDEARKLKKELQQGFFNQTRRSENTMESLERINNLMADLAESLVEKQQQVSEIEYSIRSGHLPEGMDEAAITQFMIDFAAEKSKLTALQKLASFLQLASGVKGQLVGFDELTEVLSLVAHDIAKEGIEPISELVSNIMPAINEVLASAGKTVEPVIIEAINLVINEIVNVGVGIQESQKRLYSLKAGNRKNQLDAYMTAGFDRNEAMALLLNDSKAINSALLKNIGDTVSKAGSEASRRRHQI